ncbi:hypothetical protein [Niveibacterium sp. COAC-50]|uniref:hypothetical protein n=1 Tax=Niveibacterium sp. COAC-50 TaxID=2729384 RepID=UPI001554C0E3|nr:hypothetical protein [Niveibacterium sp. COAC-50]
MFLRVGLISFVSLILSACGNLQAVRVAEVPSDIRSGGLSVAESRPTKDLVAPRAYEVPERSLFVQQTSGGNAALGVLLGPLGVLANSANIDRITQEMGESGKSASLYTLDSLDLAKSAWADRIPAKHSSAQLIQLKPYLVLLSQGKDLPINTLIAVRAEGPTAIGEAKTPWTGNYFYCSNRTLPAAWLSSPIPTQELDVYKASIKAGFTELLSEIERDLSTTQKPKRDIAWVDSPECFGNSVGMPGDIGKNEAGHLTLRAMWGDYGRIYNLMVFTSDSQYRFSNGPVARESK